MLKRQVLKRAFSVVENDVKVFLFNYIEHTLFVFLEATKIQSGASSSSCLFLLISTLTSKGCIDAPKLMEKSIPLIFFLVCLTMKVVC